MQLRTEAHATQVERWPAAGRVILAQFDADSVVVYQAYRPAIGLFAASHGHFGGEFSAERMSWIKPSFLWMMYRSRWGTTAGQETILAVTIRRAAFDEILARAVPSSHDRDAYESRAAWSAAVASSEVRLQWDPDHDPSGGRLQRRAIQLGLRGAVLRSYAREWIVSIEDISPFVAAQRENALRPGWPGLTVPQESVYPVTDAAVAGRLGVAPARAG